MNERDIQTLVEKVLKEVLESEECCTTGSSPHPSVQASPAAGFIFEGDCIPDIREEDYRSECLVDNMKNKEAFMSIKAKTDARIGTGRCGPRYRTKPYLRVLADHAGALDAVLNEPPEELIKENGLVEVQTLCDNKDTYMTRPDLGRQFSDETKSFIKENCKAGAQVQIIASEGLSSTALERNLTDLLAAINQGLHSHGISTGTPIYVRYSRVPAMDVITELLKPEVTVMIIGERPGLSTYESLSAYMTYGGYVGIPEAKRTVVSNIHANGTLAAEAGAEISDLISRMLKAKASGTDFSN